MFAIIRTGGKQYRIEPGDILAIERLRGEPGDKIDFQEVLLIDDGEKTLLGTPCLEKALVKAELIDEFKDDKVIVFKKKRRKQYRKKRGHRQVQTRVKILEIIPDLEQYGEKIMSRMQVPESQETGAEAARPATLAGPAKEKVTREERKMRKETRLSSEEEAAKKKEEKKKIKKASLSPKEKREKEK